MILSKFTSQYTCENQFSSCSNDHFLMIPTTNPWFIVIRYAYSTWSCKFSYNDHLDLLKMKLVSLFGPPVFTKSSFWVLQIGFFISFAWADFSWKLNFFFYARWGWSSFQVWSLSVHKVNILAASKNGLLNQISLIEQIFLESGYSYSTHDFHKFSDLVTECSQSQHAGGLQKWAS